MLLEAISSAIKKTLLPTLFTTTQIRCRLTHRCLNELPPFGKWIKCKLGEPSFLRKRGTIARRIVLTCYLYAFTNKFAIRLLMAGFKLNAILMFLPIWFYHTVAIASTWQPVQNLSTTLPALGCPALQRVIGWERSCNCFVTSWSQRRRPKNGGRADRRGSTCHAYGRKFAIKIAC